MSSYRRRMFLYYVLLLLIIVQPLIYIFYSSNSHCVNEKIPTLILDNVIDKRNIVNLNTRILCWIPTTLKRLDRAVVVYE